MNRVAFELSGPLITRVTPLGPFRPHHRETWYLDRESEIGKVPTAAGWRLELTDDLLDGCELSMERVARCLEMSAASPEFARLYGSLFAMVQPPQNAA